MVRKTCCRLEPSFSSRGSRSLEPGHQAGTNSRRVKRCGARTAAGQRAGQVSRIHRLGCLRLLFKAQHSRFSAPPWMPPLWSEWILPRAPQQRRMAACLLRPGASWAAWMGIGSSTNLGRFGRFPVPIQSNLSGRAAPGEAPLDDRGFPEVSRARTVAGRAGTSPPLGRERSHAPHSTWRKLRGDKSGTCAVRPRLVGVGLEVLIRVF